jgi:hypothetical protein
MAPTSSPSPNNRRTLPSSIGAAMLALVVSGLCGGLIFSRHDQPAPQASAATQTTTTSPPHRRRQAELPGGDLHSSPEVADSRLSAKPENEFFGAAADEIRGAKAAARVAADKIASPALVEQATTTLEAQAANTLAPLVGLPHPPPQTRPRPRQDNGIIFSGPSDQIALVKAQMGDLLKQMQWTAGQVLVSESASGERIAYMLNGTPGDTNTFVLSQQPQLGIAPETISYINRQGHSKKLAIVSQKEILAAMLQSGRAFAFAGPLCNVGLLQEQIALRQNLVYWGMRADWVFPEDKIYRYNTADYWQVMAGDDWTLKPGIAARTAIADAFVGKFSYQIGCTSACRFIFAHGILDFFEHVRRNPVVLERLEQLLDARRPFVGIAPQVDRNRVVVKEGRLMDRHLEVPWNHWVPGDWGWIKNPDDKSSEELGSEGCNIIYAGGGFFVNYYPERPPKTLDQALKRVYGWRFGLEESELDLPAEVMDELRRDPRSGGMLRDVRDFPKHFGVSAAPVGA